MKSINADTCHACGAPADSTTLHHVVAESESGRDFYLCNWCREQAGDTVRDFGQAKDYPQEIDAPREIAIGTLYTLRRDVSTVVKVIEIKGRVVLAAFNAMRAEHFLPHDLSAEMHPDCPHCGIPMYAADDPNGIVWDTDCETLAWAHAACATVEAAEARVAARIDEIERRIAAENQTALRAERRAIKLDSLPSTTANARKAAEARDARENAHARVEKLAEMLAEMRAAEAVPAEIDYASLFAGCVIGDEPCAECRQTDVHLWGCSIAQAECETDAEALERSAKHEEWDVDQARQANDTYRAKFAERDAHNHRVQAADRRAAAQAHRVARAETTSTER